MLQKRDKQKTRTSMGLGVISVNHPPRERHIICKMLVSQKMFKN
jgi:hypothetical protein